MRSLRREIAKLRRDSVIETALAVLRYPQTLRKRAAYRDMLGLDSPGKRFAEIYRRGLWHSRESGSGQGSEVAYTRNIREFLPKIIRKYDIRSMVDAPCGDFNWMRLVLPDVDVSYAGFDIVEPVIRENQRRYAGARVRFETADICADPLPAADLLMVRDCLFHLSFRDIDRFLRNIRRVEYRFLLTSTHLIESEATNLDIESGDFRLIDLFDAPFGFPPDAVLARVDDFPPGYSIRREMVLFRKEDVPGALF